MLGKIPGIGLDKNPRVAQPRCLFTQARSRSRLRLWTDSALQNFLSIGDHQIIRENFENFFLKMCANQAKRKFWNFWKKKISTFFLMFDIFNPTNPSVVPQSLFIQKTSPIGQGSVEICLENHAQKMSLSTLNEILI